MYLEPLHLPKANVLVLEEDAGLRTGLCSLLSAVGYGLVEAQESARPAGRIDLVLAGIDARNASKAALRLLDRSAPVILLIDHAAWTSFDFFDAANDLGAVAVLQRPFSRGALLRLVAQVLSSPPRNEASVDNSAAALADVAEPLTRQENPNFA